jgi:hypothetical protein
MQGVVAEQEEPEVGSAGLGIEAGLGWFEAALT